MVRGQERIRKKADCLALYWTRKVSGNICSAGPVAPSPPALPSRKVPFLPFTGCNVQLKLFPPLLGGIFWDLLRQTHCVGWLVCLFVVLFPKAVWLLTPPCLCLDSPRQCDGLQALSLHPHFGGEVGRDLHRGRCAQGALQRGAGWSGHRPVPLSSPRCGQNLFHWQCANWHQGKGTFSLSDTRGP